ncbi:MAG: carbohydrate ABC transporter permease [Lachnospiraceae bacterium]|jgi:multiple sugar transport system permease protein|nr:carbohydrate ABC transporter permease [Lachnospiraceae bacterium]
MHSRKTSKAIKMTTTYVILIISLLWTIFPLYWMVKSSFTIDKEMYVARPALFDIAFTTEHYVDLMVNAKFLVNLGNSLMIAAITTIFGLTVSVFASYAMTRLKYPGRKFFSSTVIISYLLPTAVLFIPMYIFVSKLGLGGTRWAMLVIYPTFVVPYCCYMLRSYFTAIPYALEEAALIDGCTRLQSLRHIVVPIALPGIAVTATFAFTMSWNEYLYAMIMTTSMKEMTATVAISSWKYGDIVNWGRIMAGCVVASLPVTIIYIIAQSLLVSGKADGSVK